jgi:hypothetical protein
VVRRDPDGKAIRLALAQKVTVHSIATGSKFFVDLLPVTWSGPPPSLPEEVVEELARRAREAERLDRLAHRAEEKKKLAPVRVHVASLPTFTRYVFDLPEQVDVTADRAKERLTLTFDAPLPFDLIDVQSALPASVSAINAEVEEDSALVRFSFTGPVDLRTFRDGKAYVVDVVKGDASAAPRDKTAANVVPTLGVEAGLALKVPGLEGPPPAAVAEKPSPPPAAVAVQPMAAQPVTTQPVTMPPAPTPPTAMQTMAAPLMAKQPMGGQPMPMQPVPAQSVSAQAPLAQPAGAQPAKANPEAASMPAPKPAMTEPVMPRPPAPLPPNAAAPIPQAPVVQANPAPQAAKAEAPPMNALPVAAAEPARPREKKSADAISVELIHQGADLKLSFPFMTPTAAAVFHRADTLWLVFDTKATIDVDALSSESSRTIRGVAYNREADVGVVRIELDHPHLASVAAEGSGWTVTVGDSVTQPTHALDLARNMIGANRASVAVAFEEPHGLHRLHDPVVGDDLLVVTGFAPARGFISEQDFVEFHALASTQGVVIEPLADDLTVELATGKIVIGRPGGLTLSTSLQSVLHGSTLRPMMFDAQVWGLDRQSDFSDRQSQLIAAAAAAPANKRLPQRLDLARFYIARDMYSEAKGVLDVLLSEERASSEDVTASVLRAAAEVLMDRPDDALKDLGNSAVGDQHDAPLWRALAYAGQGKWALARENFKRVEASVATLPIELQRIALASEMRAAIEVGDFGGAATDLNDLQTIGLPDELQPSVSVLAGRLSEGTGRNEDALTAYRAAADSWDRPAAAQGRLHEASLRYTLGNIKREEVVDELETLTTIWRGDETEIGALEILARLYTEEGRYRDSFYVMRSAVSAHPDSDLTHRIMDEAAATFDSLFLAGKGDTLSVIDALALFYDFRELTPIGRRGDEMIRRLADRLVSVDLLDQAAALLQYQVDHRLQGAARAQVATRLAVIYLMNHKPDRALATLHDTRTSDLAIETRNQRLLLEARALSDLGRFDLALEVVGNLEGRETIRLRSDILWAARRWAQAAEQIELYYGERWQDWQPLNDVERTDILRAAIGYALGEDMLGLGRFREKYAAKMAQTPDAKAFETASAPLGTSGKEFRDIAHAAASVDTLEGFLRDMQARYPDAGAAPSASPAPAASAPGSPSSAADPATRRAAGKTALR